MTDTPEKKRKRKGKEPIRMTDDELMDRVFNKTVRKKLKKIAEEARPKADNNK